jgi:hypothetical protein
LLEIDQILHLWERVLGFMDPTLLVIAAVAIFTHRSEMLLRVSSLFSKLSHLLILFFLKCSNETEATMILMEGSRLHIIPIIQAFLLKDGRNP